MWTLISPFQKYFQFFIKKMDFLDRFEEETLLVPLMENYIENDDYYFLNDEGEKIFN